MKLNGIDYHWNHSTNGAWLEIESGHSTSVWFHSIEIGPFLKGLEYFINKADATTSVELGLQQEIKIDLAPYFHYYITYEISFSGNTTLISLRPQGNNIITLAFDNIFDLKQLKNYLEETNHS
jgi:hypothetical protein